MIGLYFLVFFELRFSKNTKKYEGRCHIVKGSQSLSLLGVIADSIKHHYSSNGDVAPAKTVDSMNDQLLQYTAQAEKEKADQLAQQQKQQQEQQEQPPQEAAAAEEGAMEADADEGDEPEIS